MPVSMKVDPRFLTASGPEVFNGNELLIKGALETEGGVHLLGGYPGSPAAAYFDAMAHIKDLLAEKGIRAIMNCNEALAAAMLNGSQVIGCRGMIVMKSVGVHVAADALALGNLAGAHTKGGAIVVYGDDPWSDSTQVPADSRYISKHLFIPVIEPSTPQEIKDFVELSFKLSARSELYAGFVLTTNLADGGGSVQCRPNQYPSFNMNQRLTLDTAAIDLNKFVLLPPRTWWQEEKLAPRFERAMVAARELGLNKILYAGDSAVRKPIGFVASGLAHAYLQQSLWEMGLLGQMPILKFGMSYPVDPVLVRQLAGMVDRIVVVEERRGFVEEQISQIILNDRQQGLPSGQTEVWGKAFPGGLRGLPATRGLHPSIIIEHVAPLISQFGGKNAARASETLASRAGATSSPRSACGFDGVRRELDTIGATAQADIPSPPARTPTFCPGCPHRDSAGVCLDIKKQFMDADYMAKAHGKGAIDLMFHGDTGCYTMLMFPPTSPLMHDYSGMGLGAGTGTGTDPFITNKQVVFMGDGTFFHSGQLAVSQAIKVGQDITFIILDNSTTAMTGHQPTSGVDYDIVGDKTPIQDIEEVVSGMAGNSTLSIVRADPEQRVEYRRLLEKTFLADGVKVVIATKECGITRMRRKRRSERTVAKQLGYLPRWEHMNINSDICRFCMACAEMTGCPGLKHVQTEYGAKMDTDISWCVNDGACQRIRACSSFEQVTIKRRKPPRNRLPELTLEDIPEPQRRQFGDLWRGCLTGVGGMGIGVATSILVRAGHKEGYDVIFLDKKGLAIRNGGVVSQIVYNISRQPITAVIPYGKADLLLGIDILEAARALDPRGRSRIASSDKTAAVVNTDKIQTIWNLLSLKDDFDVKGLEELIRQNTRGSDFLARNISRICEKYLGNKLYANIMMLGFAFQKGLIPVSMHSMAWAIKDTIRTDFRKNLYAFNMGRKLVLNADLFQGPPARQDWRDLLEDKCRSVIRRYGRKGQRLSDDLRELLAGAIEAMATLDDGLKMALVTRAYDCLRWGGIVYAALYIETVRGTYRCDWASRQYAATRAVLFNLAKAMLMKDGVFIAELATSPEKYARDREKYSINPSNGDKIQYRHLLQPRFKLLGRQISFDLAAGPWVLRLMRRQKWLRKLPNWNRSAKRFLAQYFSAVDEFAAAKGTGAKGTGSASPSVHVPVSTVSPDGYATHLAKLSNPQCLGCMAPSCKDRGCPLGNCIPQCLELANEGRWREAADLLLSTNNFPEFTSRICPSFCSDNCKQAAGGYSVDFRAIETQIIDRAFAEGWISPRPPGRSTGKKVAIVGSGPAGLAAAQQLARGGHSVTVFEKDQQVGGLLRYGIPSFRLEKTLIDRRIEQLKAEGITFRTGASVGEEIPAVYLREQFDAVLLAGGATRSRDIKVAGRQLGGIHQAMDYLRAAGSNGDSRVSAAGKSVVVIGGGLTGEDCVETALLQGATEVHQFEIMTQPPAKSNGHAEEPPANLTRRYGISTQGFMGTDGSLAAVQAAHVRWTSSPNGPAMQVLESSRFEVKADMAILAMGFEPAADEAIAAPLGLAVDARGRLVTTDMATSADGVFAAGDLAGGPSYVAKAIAAGRDAAVRIDKYLAQNCESRVANDE